ncbi:MAG: nitrilase-related carbon-nitrogen hydrolase, partial [Nannocystaceae bacterium]
LIGLGTHVPGRTPQNQVVLVAADGRVRSSRAKRLLLPVAERRFLGVGKDNYHIGEATTVLKHAQRAFVAMICGEYLDRSLIAEGVRAGGEILAIVARDRWTDERADRQLLAIQVLRSVEFGLPSVRSSLMGQATFVAADGRVLARSSQQRNGVLTWDSQAGSRDLDFRGDPIGELADEEAPPQPAADVAVLYSEKAQHLRARCPGGRCSHFSLEGFTCPDKRHPAVIVSGHGRPPDYLSHPLDEVVAAIRCFEPELVIVDTCFGASSELVSALGDLDAVVVASPSLLPSSGFVYGAEFFTSTQRSLRAAAVNTQPNTELMRWQLNSGELTALLERVGAMNSEELGAHLARRNPSMIKVLLPNGSPVLVPVAWKRFGNSRPPPKRLRPRSHGRRRQP